MLAYIFWHRPYSNTERQRYEQAIVRFQKILPAASRLALSARRRFRSRRCPGSATCPVMKIGTCSTAPGAMDPLNAFAISGHVQAPHDSVAATMEQGHGGLYAHAGGESMPAPRSTIHWLTRPRGIQWQPAIEAVRGSCPQAKAWRRQMVLGPAAEFAVETPAEAEIDVPVGRACACRTRCSDPLATIDHPATSLGLRCAIAIRPSAIIFQKK